MKWLRELAVFPIRLYQRYLSPLKPPTCRFHPTCSAYAVEAVRVHGLLRGFGLGAWRILRCQPFSKGGYDPVPPPRSPRGDAEPPAPHADENPAQGSGDARR